MQSETKSRVDQLTTPAGHPVSVLRFEGDIASTSKDAVLGAYQELSKKNTPLILLDFTKVFTMVGIPKYATLFPTQAEALAAL